MTQKAKDGFVLFGAFLIYVFGMLVVCLIDWLFRSLKWRSNALDAAWCFLLTAVVFIGGFVAVGYFIEWLCKP